MRTLRAKHEGYLTVWATAEHLGSGLICAPEARAKVP
jgi:hypothetical protein